MRPSSSSLACSFPPDRDLSGRPRAGLVIVANEQTPYRLHFHRRIVAELPEVELYSVFTHEVASSPWRLQDDESIHPVRLGRGESATRPSRWVSLPRDWRKGGAILRWLRARNTQAVVVGGYNDLTRIRLLYWCRRQGIPCFLFGDSNILADPASGLRARLKRVLLPPVLRACTGVFCCGSLGRRYFESYGVPPERIYHVPYEPDYGLIRDLGPKVAPEVRARFGLPGTGRRFLLYAGRLVPAKRVDLLIDAFARIAARHPEWDLIVAGDGPLRSWLAASVPTELSRRVHWTGFIADQATLAGLYAAADVFVLPSDYEPWGVVLSEAAVHCALVASSVVGAAADLLADGVNGRLFASGDLQDLAASLLAVTQAGGLAEMKRASARILARWRQSCDPVEGLRRALSDAGTFDPTRSPILT